MNLGGLNTLTHNENSVHVQFKTAHFVALPSAVTPQTQTMIFLFAQINGTIFCLSPMHSSLHILWFFVACMVSEGFIQSLSISAAFIVLMTFWNSWMFFCAHFFFKKFQVHLVSDSSSTQSSHEIGEQCQTCGAVLFCACFGLGAHFFRSFSCILHILVVDLFGKLTWELTIPL